MIISSQPLPPPVINSISGSGTYFNRVIGLSFSSATWPSSNRAYFLPFTLDMPIVATKLFVANGATASGNFDIGIYDDSGTRIVSTGSTAQSGTSDLQVVDITDTLIGPGQFFLALAFDNTTATVFRANLASGSDPQAIGEYTQNSAFALPASATFATAASQFWPLFGLATVTTV